MAGKHPIEVCALCAERPVTTREHVPGRSLFPDPKPDNLITVPACAACNNGSSADDEYFLDNLGLIHEEKPSAALEQLRPKITRGLNRPRAARLFREFAGRLRFGVPPGRRILQPIINVDQDRLIRVVQKHARGLYYELVHVPLHASYTTMVMPVARLRGVPADMLAFWEKARSLARGGLTRNIGPDIFEFHLNPAQDNAYVFCARLLYYGAFEYLVQSIPREAAPPQ